MGEKCFCRVILLLTIVSNLNATDDVINVQFLGTNKWDLSTRAKSKIEYRLIVGYNENIFPGHTSLTAFLVIVIWALIHRMFSCFL